jgi:ElaA protein
MHLDWQIKHYRDLSLNEFHDIIALRMAAFVVEQDCPYQDLDGKDKKSYHLICRNGKGDIVATARILPPGLSYEDAAAVGRVVLEDEIRGYGHGHELMDRCIAFCGIEFGNSKIRISAQKHLEKYYEKHEFLTTGKEYLEDGIPHVEMLYTPKN